MADNIGGFLTPLKVMVYNATIASSPAPTSTTFTTKLKGFRNTFFENWTVYVVRKYDNTGNAPQGDFRTVTDYYEDTNGGHFTIDSAFSATQLSIGDEIFLIHPFITANTNVLVIPSNNVKQSGMTEVCTAAIVPTKLMELTFTGKAGGARLSVKTINNGGGTASAWFYKNGALAGTSVVMTNATAAYVTFTQDVWGLVAGDLIQVYARISAAPFTACVKEFTISYDVVMVAAAQLGQDMVYIDPAKGITGTAWPAGAAGFPVNNLTDAITIAHQRATNNLHVKNLLTIDQDLNTERWNFFGDGDDGVSGVNFDSHDVDYCTFNDMALVGSNPGWIYARNCFVTGEIDGGLDYAQIIGRFINCLIGSIWAIPSLTEMITCIGCNAMAGGYTQSTSGGGYIYWAGGSGMIVYELSDHANSLLIVISIDTAVLLSATSTAGEARIYLATVYNNNINFPAFLFQEYSSYAAGKTCVFAKAITSAANAGDVTLGTNYYSSVQMESIILRAIAAAPAADFQNIGIYANASKITTLINPGRATLADLDAIDKQVQAVGPWILGAGKTIVATLTGSGATAVSFYVYIKYTPFNNKAKIY